MKRTIISAIFIFFLISNLVQAQSSINSGFYFQLGPVFPQGTYAAGDPQVLTSTGVHSIPGHGISYLPAKIGAGLDLGFLIYIGPAFAKKHIRAGIDATFLSVWYNSSKPDSATTVTDNYYYYGGQKFGPVITINPVDRLMIDLSYKLNFNLAYHFGEWHSYADNSFSKYGANLTQNEMSVAIRYLIMKFALQYNWGKMTYDNLDKTRPSQMIQTNTLRIMVGLIF